MTTNKLLEPLTHVVQMLEVGPGGGEWWETIAAFNVEMLADKYAEACRRGTRRSYRVEAIT